MIKRYDLDCYLDCIVLVYKTIVHKDNSIDTSVGTKYIKTLGYATRIVYRLTWFNKGLFLG